MSQQRQFNEQVQRSGTNPDTNFPAMIMHIFTPQSLTSFSAMQFRKPYFIPPEAKGCITLDEAGRFIEEANEILRSTHIPIYPTFFLNFIIPMSPMCIIGYFSHRRAIRLDELCNRWNKDVFRSRGAGIAVVYPFLDMTNDDWISTTEFHFNIRKPDRTIRREPLNSYLPKLPSTPRQHSQVPVLVVPTEGVLAVGLFSMRLEEPHFQRITSVPAELNGLTTVREINSLIDEANRKFVDNNEDGMQKLVNLQALCHRWNEMIFLAKGFHIEALSVAYHRKPLPETNKYKTTAIQFILHPPPNIPLVVMSDGHVDAVHLAKQEIQISNARESVL